MREFQFIEVSGKNSFECGVCYGQQAADKIRAGAEDYRKVFEKSYKRSWEEIKELALAYIKPVGEWAPDLIEEVKGIAEGAGLDLGSVMVLNCRYELTKLPKPHECTTGVALPEATGAGTYLFKNWDYRSGILDNIVLLHITEADGTRTIGICEAGQLIRDGINSHGVALVSNNLTSVQDSGKMAIPSCFMRRRVTKSRSFEEACDILRTFPRHVSCNTLVASADGRATDFEVYPEGTDEILPERGVITHANHFIVNPALDAITGRPKNRDARLRELLMEKHGEIDVPYIQHCLKDHKYMPLSICGHCSNDPADVYGFDRMTVSSTVFDFARGEAHICAGNPCEGEYKVYKL